MDFKKIIIEMLDHATDRQLRQLFYLIRAFLHM